MNYKIYFVYYKDLLNNLAKLQSYKVNFLYQSLQI